MFLNMKDFHGAKHGALMQLNIYLQDSCYCLFGIQSTRTCFFVCRLHQHHSMWYSFPGTRKFLHQLYTSTPNWQQMSKTCENVMKSWEKPKFHNCVHRLRTKAVSLIVSMNSQYSCTEIQHRCKTIYVQNKTEQTTRNGKKRWIWHAGTPWIGLLFVFAVWQLALVGLRVDFSHGSPKHNAKPLQYAVDNHVRTQDLHTNGRLLFLGLMALVDNGNATNVITLSAQKNNI